MQGVAKSKIEGLRLRIFNEIPTSLKPYAKLAYFALRTPFGGRKNSNTFRYEMSVSKTERINFVPPVFVVTINSTCNLRCPNCFYVLRGGDHAFEGGAMIKVDDFKAVIDKYADYIQVVFLTGGEALAHPRLDQLVNIVKSKGIELKVSTNGVFIDRKIDVLKAFDFINVSMDGFDHESFKRYRAGTPAEFDKIVYGLSLLRENNIPFGNSFVLSQENIHEVNSMLEFADIHKSDLVTFHNINPHGCEDFTPLVRSSERVQQMLRDITSRDDYPYDITLPVIFDTDSRDFIKQKCAQQWAYAAFNDNNLALNVTSHKLMLVAPPIFEAYDERARIVEVVRHPLYMVTHWYSYFQRFDSPREFTVSINHNGIKVPWFAHGWEGEFVELNTMDRALLSIVKLYGWVDVAVQAAIAEGRRVLVLTFESLVMDPQESLQRLISFLGSSHHPRLSRILRRQKVPRRMVSQGRGHVGYGWGKEPSTSELDSYKRSLDCVNSKGSASAVTTFLNSIESYNRKYPSVLAEYQ